MTRKFFVKICPIIAFVFILALSFNMPTTNASASTLPQNLKIDSVDGQTYNAQKHKKIVAFIIYRNAVQGEHILGFSTLEKYNAYKQQNLATQNADAKAAAYTYFYEHTSFDNRGLGASIRLQVGYNFYYVGDNWNDRISSTNIHPSSSITIYQHWHYEGYHYTFVNNGGNYWFRNFTDYKMPNGHSWNDQISSVKSGW
jgi:hypothetical protein